MLTIRSRHPLIAIAESISHDVLRSTAADVDRNNRFPLESIDALRESGLLRAVVPERNGGFGIDVLTFCQIASALGESCLSTAFIFAQHSQQVAVLADFAETQMSGIISAIVNDGPLVASVTTENGKGGELLAAEAPLNYGIDGVSLVRESPIVSYGCEAGVYLITMRAGIDAPQQDVRIAVVTGEDGEVRSTGGWQAMGMRGTCSVPMTFDVQIDRSRVIDAPFATIASQTFVPFAHIGWAACWYGAASGALRRFVRQIRKSPSLRHRMLHSDQFTMQLADIRTSLDLFGALLSQVAGHYQMLRGGKSVDAGYEDTEFLIALNNLKIAGSNIAVSVVDRLITLSGMTGYIWTEIDSLERVFRDLRSAPLMFHNDRLLRANGKLSLLEGHAAGLLA